MGGKGSPVLVLHGAPGPTALTALAEHLARNHYVVAPTHPGWEGTARPDDLDSVPALAAVCLELLDRLGLSRVTVVGTSFGGWVATQVALDGREGQVSRLVLMDAIGPVIPGHWITVPSGPPTPRPSDPAARPPARGGPPARTTAALRAYTGPDMQDPGLLPRLGKLALPVLVIWAGTTTSSPPPMAGPTRTRSRSRASRSSPAPVICPCVKSPRPSSPSSTTSSARRTGPDVLGAPEAPAAPKLLTPIANTPSPPLVSREHHDQDRDHHRKHPPHEGRRTRRPVGPRAGAKAG
ncbi:alpha/beta hydrolase [Streptomyces sp. ME03-5684b]|uniref:alpha/beta fold hydrolase n=1 Tax=Streptomyces sp. ME03-5684b TaxID=3028681 RepID=UPI0029B4A81B|nr:alpha/beta hydrolase [Streptomyces sp. ME03-5684b]MDX3321201.1 alpha/beta hydrolase [Streptomyces sp. ME03-5684b]